MKLSDREKKLLILAFDPGATAGEAMNALRVVFRDWINKYPDGHALTRDLESGGSVIQEQRASPHGNVILGFGRYRGKCLRDVPADYLLWVLSNFSGLWPETRTAIERYLGESSK
jgi:hypothetical protein